jgi:hypothetical protein
MWCNGCSSLYGRMFAFAKCRQWHIFVLQFYCFKALETSYNLHRLPDVSDFVKFCPSFWTIRMWVAWIQTRFFSTCSHIFNRILCSRITVVKLTANWGTKVQLRIPLPPRYCIVLPGVSDRIASLSLCYACVTSSQSITLPVRRFINRNVHPVGNCGGFKITAAGAVNYRVSALRV